MLKKLVTEGSRKLPLGSHIIGLTLKVLNRRENFINLINSLIFPMSMTLVLKTRGPTQSYAHVKIA